MKTLEEYIIQANKIHNNKYHHLKIICQTHGEFQKRVTNHILLHL